MKKSIMNLALTAFAFCGLAMTSCSTVATSAGMGLVYTETSDGLLATSNTIGSKVGTSENLGVLGLVVTGDASIQAAAKQAGITRISHVDSKTSSILGLFAKHTTIVYGE